MMYKSQTWHYQLQSRNTIAGSVRRAILRYGKLLWVIIGCMILSSSSSLAQEPVVYGVFFYSPTCPHCHEVIENHWPGIQAEFGDQLVVRFINIMTNEGNWLMQVARQSLDIESSGVPMLIIGDHVLIGSVDIPHDTPLIVQQGLAAGGIAIPDIPGILPYFEPTYIDPVLASTDADTPAVWERLRADPYGNSTAILILLGLMVSVMTVISGGSGNRRHKPRPFTIQLDRIIGRWALILASGVGLLLTVSVLLTGERGIPLLLAAGVALIFMLLLIMIIRHKTLHQLPQWILVPVLLAGILIAAYMTYVESTASNAVCGALGDCNLVQQSRYAKLMGIPIGAIGIAGYASLLLIWLMNRREQLDDIDRPLFFMAMAGVLFSIYLTFLEPFVIGASCVWCLTSSILMLILLWLAAPALWKLRPTEKAQL